MIVIVNNLEVRDHLVEVIRTKLNLTEDTPVSVSLGYLNNELVAQFGIEEEPDDQLFDATDLVSGHTDKPVTEKSTVGTAAVKQAESDDTGTSKRKRSRRTKEQIEADNAAASDSTEKEEEDKPPFEVDNNPVEEAKPIEVVEPDLDSADVNVNDNPFASFEDAPEPATDADKADPFALQNDADPAQNVEENLFGNNEVEVTQVTGTSKEGFSEPAINDNPFDKFD